MRYLVAILVPWLAFFTIGRFWAGLICLILQVTLVGWIPAAVWALLAVSDFKADRRADRIIRETKGPGAP
ncbi:MAG: YqaE/Pmp3 family membrane protein [Hyphomicrobiales bacterium]|nr:YqaE/Pmp3 family membrane protein [Hyphomicrobiales bacterium]MDE2018019.1 YqaE/Pmp3 family membrane protein [Hyphomicrobiales bacterium]